MDMSVLMTNVCQYTGPGSVPVLLSQHNAIYCHDGSFVDPVIAQQFETDHLGAVALSAQTPQTLADELASLGIGVETVIHNDVHPNTPLPIEEISLEMLQASFEALLLFPARLTQLLLPAMKKARRGRFVFVTSARYLQPEPGFAVATSIRAATTTFAQALAREVAPHAIQVNVVAPNYLYSEAYYPRARFIDDPAGREQIAAKVPLGRLGKPEEIGELIAFLASGRSPFITGQVIDFTGGWP
jgi:NAD(P)-dependent dehydrogenase (short-subunit alcohol dehydrogenase family)